MHQLDPRVKLGLTLSFILATAATPPGAWPALILFAAMAIAAVILAELPAVTVLARVALALPFVLAALPLLVTTPGTPLWHLPWGWAVTTSGAVRVASLALKTTLSVAASVVLTATTTMNHLLAALRALGLPRPLVAVLGLMWRYLFVLIDETRRLLRARAARSGASTTGRQGGSLAWRTRVTGGMAGNLLLRSFERADHIYAAMRARGYDGEIRTAPLPPLRRSARAGLALGGLALGILVFMSLIGRG